MRVSYFLVAALFLTGCSSDSTPIAALISPTTRVTSATFKALPAIPVQAKGDWVEVADLNHDGKLDLVLALADRVVTAQGLGDGTFQAAQTVSLQSGFVVAVGDLNNDGFPDIASAPFNTTTLQLIPGHGDGTFGAEVPLQALGNLNEVRIGDFNGDGRPDLILNLPDSNQVECFLNQGGSGAFNFGAGISSAVTNPRGLALGQFTHDSNLDLGVGALNPAQAQLLLGQGNGTFTAGTARPVGSGVFSAATGDFDGDSNLDLVTLELSNTTTINYGDGQGSFRGSLVLPTSDESFQVVTADLNGDGRPDILVGCRASGVVNLFLNDGQGGFTRLADLIAPQTVALTTGDLNGDGIVDVVTVGEDSQVRVFLGQP